MVRRLIALGIAVSIGMACARTAKKAEPIAALSKTPEAAADFAILREAWRDRKVDQPSLESFIARYPNDGAVPLARIYLSYVFIENGNLAAADGVLHLVGELPLGTTRDLATIMRARSLRLHNAPKAALDSLSPLEGKVVDDADREIFLEELALSAIAAQDNRGALGFLDSWLRGVGEDDKDRVKAKISQILVTLPRKGLEDTYRKMKALGPASGYGADTQKLVAERLAHIAVETNDAALARWLVDVSGVSATETGGDAGLELGELAASRRGLSMFAGRTVGVLLPTRDRELRDEAADVVRGVSWALGLPRPPGQDDGTRLITREDGSDLAATRSAMEELSGEGAAVIIAGFDRASADRASAWADSNEIGVMMLSVPSKPSRRAFVLGQRTDREIAMLADALVKHGAKTAAFIADSPDDDAAAASIDRTALTLLPPVRCDVPLVEAGKPRFPIEQAWKAGARGWLVSGPPACGRDVLRDIGIGLKVPANTSPAIALTLEAGVPTTEVPKGVTVLSASAGIVPVLAATSKDANDTAVAGFMDRFGVRPSYWTALGNDAGTLARTALAPLPKEATSDPKLVAQRRAAVQSGLLSARSRLWTTDDRGIASDRVLPRTLKLVSWEKGSQATTAR